MARLKLTKGRQKVPMAKIERSTNLQVTFSKRRNGIFKKTSELSTLCGVEVCIIVFSPGGKVYSFGHPSVETVVERYMTGAPRCNAAGGEHMLIMEAHRMVTVQDLNAKLNLVQSQIEDENQRSEGLEMQLAQMRNRCWWAQDLDKLSQQQLMQQLEALQHIKYKACEARDHLTVNGGGGAAVADHLHHSQCLTSGASSSTALMTQPQQLALEPPPVFQTQAYQPLAVVPNPTNQNPVLLQKVKRRAHDLLDPTNQKPVLLQNGNQQAHGLSTLANQNPVLLQNVNSQGNDPSNPTNQNPLLLQNVDPQVHDLRNPTNQNPVLRQNVNMQAHVLSNPANQNPLLLQNVNSHAHGLPIPANQNPVLVQNVNHQAYGLSDPTNQNPVLLENVNPQAHGLLNPANQMMHLQNPQLTQHSVLLHYSHNQISQNVSGYEANIINQVPDGLNIIDGSYGLGDGFNGLGGGFDDIDDGWLWTG